MSDIMNVIVTSKKAILEIILISEMHLQISEITNVTC